MIDPTETPDDKVTYTDWLLARAFFPVLVRLAFSGSTKNQYTYNELIARAKEESPDVPEVQRTIPLQAGRGLGTIRKYSRKLGYPDLSCLVVNAAKKECGSGYTNYHDAVAAREKAYAYEEWATVLANFDGFAEFEPTKQKRKTAITDGKPKSSRMSSQRRASR